MAAKLGRKEMVAGHGPEDFEIMGRAAKDQGDFGSDVGCADMACVNQFGANNAKSGSTTRIDQLGTEWPKD